MNKEEDIIDPWNLKDLFELKPKMRIKGPIDSKIKRHILLFEYITNNNYSILMTIDNNSSNYKHISIKLYNDRIIIDNISKSEIYRGSEHVLLALQIIYRINNKNLPCILVDSSFFTCIRRVDFFKKYEEIQYKIINLLKYQSTFYMPFGFLPKSKNNNRNCSNELKNIVINLYKISWKDIDDYIETMINIVKSNKYKTNVMIRNYKKWYDYWLNVYESWKYFYNKYKHISISPFLTFSVFNTDDCEIFINWLELYSFTYIEYNNFVFNEINNTKQEIAGIKDFKKLKKMVNNVIWINEDVKLQPLISIYRITI